MAVAVYLHVFCSPLEPYAAPKDSGYPLLVSFETNCELVYKDARA